MGALPGQGGDERGARGLSARSPSAAGSGTPGPGGWASWSVPSRSRGSGRMRKRNLFQKMSVNALFF